MTMGALRDFLQFLKKNGSAAPGSPVPGPAAGSAEGPVLRSITISPDKPKLIGGWPRQFKAMGKFSDGSSKDVTTAVAWSSTPDDVVSIDKAGRATPKPVTGTATITATDPSNPEVTASVTAAVTPDPTPTTSPDEDKKAAIFGNMEGALGKSPPDVAAFKRLVDAGGDQVLGALIRDRPDAFKKLVDGGGSQVLDDLIKKMPDPPDRAIITAAIEARFNIKMQDTDLSSAAADVAEGNKSIKQIYLTMLRVPESHVRNNPSLKKIERVPGTGDPSTWFPYYDTASKEAVVPAHRADLQGNPVGNTTDQVVNGKVVPAQLADVDEACQPKGTTTPSYLSWSTLHEVAHGVDDQKKAMDKGGGNDKAGWQTNTLEQVAAKVATVLKHYDEITVKWLLKAHSPDKISKPPKASKDDQKNALEWCKAIRVDNSLWMKAAESAKRAIDNRVYHEAYPGVWVSYNLAARKQGITGYQFRAPGEWFAELYAAYYSGKLKDTHPYLDWIKQF
jgi:hypothetical protein